MIRRYCHECGVYTEHQSEMCTVCFPVERHLRLLREIAPEVADPNQDEPQASDRDLQREVVN